MIDPIIIALLVAGIIILLIYAGVDAWRENKAESEK